MHAPRIISPPTLNRSLPLIGIPLWVQWTSGCGLARILDWKINRRPSSSWRIDGFFWKVGAIPSTCLFDIWDIGYIIQFKRSRNIERRDEEVQINSYDSTVLVVFPAASSIPSHGDLKLRGTVGSVSSTPSTALHVLCMVLIWFPSTHRIFIIAEIQYDNYF